MMHGTLTQERCLRLGVEVLYYTLKQNTEALNLPNEGGSSLFTIYHDTPPYCHVFKEAGCQM